MSKILCMVGCQRGIASQMQEDGLNILSDSRCFPSHSFLDGSTQEPIEQSSKPIPSIFSRNRKFIIGLVIFTPHMPIARSLVTQDVWHISSHRIKWCVDPTKRTSSPIAVISTRNKSRSQAKWHLRGTHKWTGHTPAFICPSHQSTSG